MTKLKLTLAAGFGAMTLVGSAQAETLNYGELETLFGEPVTTSATGMPQRRSEVPVTMDIITANDIRHSGATTIPQIVSQLAGVDLYTWSNNSADVAIRGLNQGASNRVMVLVNGRENYTDGLGTLLWEFIPVRLDEIRQIEVIKGPNSALYGFNASGGVINIITFNPQYDDVKAARITGVSDGSSEASVVRTFQWAGGGLRTSAGWSDNHESNFHPLSPADLNATSSPSINRTANVDLQTQVGAQSQLRLQAAMADGGLRTNYVMPLYLQAMVGMVQADFSTNTKLGMIDISAMNNDTQASVFRHSLASGKLFNDVTVVKAQDLFKIDASDTARLGVEYRRDDMPSTPVVGADLLSQTMAASAMWDHAITKDLSLLNAARIDHFSMNRSGPFLPGTTFTNSNYNERSIVDWSFNSALVYRPTQLDSIKVMAARGLSLPSLTEFGIMNKINAGPMTINSVGNPNLEPTRVMHYELSYERQIQDLAGSGRLALYHQDIDKIRDLGELSQATLVGYFPPTLQSTYINVGNARVNGLEAELKGQLGSGWHWGVNYSFETVNEDLGIDRYHNYTLSTPNHKANATLGWQQGKWEADTHIRYVSHTQMAQEDAAGTYGLYPVKAVYAVTQRVAYNINPWVRVEGNAASGFADNTVSSEKARFLASLIVTY